MDFLRTMITGNTAFNNLEFPSVYNAAGRSRAVFNRNSGRWVEPCGHSVG